MEVIWKTVNVDIYSLERSAFEKKLLASPLWPNGIPGWARAAWNELKARLHSIAPHWLVWTAWYQAQLAGRPAWGLPRPEAEALMGKAIQWADGEWMAGPDHINPRLEALVRAAGGEIGREKLPLDDPAPEQEPPPASAGWDFFVSYSQPDEAMAREIVTLLHEAGHSTFVQFNDMPPGANFVTEMQKGLAGSGRVIALYSPAYVASAHCQAEWNTAYAADPTGAKRKLLPFLIVPTDLPPLAQQVVFKSLVGLAADARKRAVLAAIAPPVARSLDEAKRAVANVASPLPKLTDKQRIGLTRNDITDTPRTTRDLAKLPRIMKMMLVENILPSLPDNTPPVVRNGLASYARHLDEQGTRLEPQYLSRVCAGVQREYESAGSDLWGAGLEEWFGKFFEDHNLVKTHFPLKDEEIYAETPIDEQAAMGEALTEPTGKVSAAAQELVDDHHAEPEVGKLFDDIAQQGRDYAHFPPDENAGQPGSTRVSVKRRYVVGTLGVFVAFYNFVGSTASILATDTGMRFFKALGEAIEKLSKLLLLS